MLWFVVKNSPVKNFWTCANFWKCYDLWRNPYFEQQMLETWMWYYENLNLCKLNVTLKKEYIAYLFHQCWPNANGKLTLSSSKPTNRSSIHPSIKHFWTPYFIVRTIYQSELKWKLFVYVQKWVLPNISISPNFDFYTTFCISKIKTYMLRLKVLSGTSWKIFCRIRSNNVWKMDIPVSAIKMCASSVGNPQTAGLGWIDDKISN